MPASKTAAKRAADPAGGPVGRDATELLVADHQEVKTRFRKYGKLAESGADGEQRQPLAEEICTLLTVHATIEEEIFYPAARAAGVESDLLDEAEVEHASAKDLIAQIRDMGPDDDLYDAKVTVLGEYIDHHVEEEQDEMFPKCRQSAMDLQAVGAQLAARKAELISEMSEGMEVVP